MAKVALITGASRGIGRAIALALAKAGYDLALVYAGDRLAAEECLSLVRQAGANAQIYQADVADFEAVKALVQAVQAELGPVYALVNNAGITNDKLVLQMSEHDFSRVLDVNLQGAFNLIRHLYQGFMKQRGGRIINISSVVGLTGNAGQANYSAAKAGLIGLTKSVAKELGARNVTCNAVAPGFIQTDMTQAMQDKAKEGLLSAIPLRRPGQPEEVASLVAFLASEQGAYITGNVIKIDGGLAM